MPMPFSRHGLPPLGLSCGLLLGVFMAAMTISPVMGRFLERYGYDGVAQSPSGVVYTWMGVLFLFFSISLFTDFLRLLARMTSMILRMDRPCVFSPLLRSP